MKYDIDRKTVRNVLRTADIANTINGGMSQSLVNFTKNADHYLIVAKVPGVNPETLNVEIVNNFVVISHSLHFGGNRQHLNIPHVIATFPISVEVDFRQISATEEDGILKVVMPFNEIAGGYRKKVTINR